MQNSLMKTFKKRKIVIRTSAIVAILIILLSITIIIINGYTKKMEEILLTQLKANTDRQMMGYILQTSNNKTVVIDGGTEGDAQNLIEWINKQGGKVDAWYITHPHIDHMGAFMKIVEETEIPIEKIYVTLNDLEWYRQNEPSRIEEIERFFTVIQNSRINDKVSEVTLGEKMEIDGLNFEILGVKNPEITNRAVNNSSMVIKMYANKTSVLFLGDTGEDSGKKLLKEQGENLKSDIVQMAHHGQNGVAEDVYKMIDPEICLWPTPEWLWNNDSGEGEDSGPWKTKTTRVWMSKLNVKENIIEKDGDQTIQIP